MKFFRLLTILTICLTFLLGFGIYRFSFKQTTEVNPSFETQTADVELQFAKTLINEGYYTQAIHVIKKHCSKDSAKKEPLEWQKLLLQANVGLKNSKELEQLYLLFPELFYENEEAALIVCENLVLMGEAQRYEKLKNIWKTKKTHLMDWLNIEVDDLVLSGKRQEAVELLEMNRLEEKEEILRLISLSLLHINEQPQKAWDYLTEAHQKDPYNPKIVAYRAELLERQEKQDAALSEYIEASALDPQNMAMRELIADFFIRHKKFQKAQGVYEESLKSLKVPQEFVLKAFFFNKVVKPIKVSWKSFAVPGEKYQSLMDYLAALGTYDYWSVEKFSYVMNHQQLLNSMQELYWLRLLSCLKKDNLQSAKELLANSRFKESSWSPDLEIALKLLINYREHQQFHLSEDSFSGSFHEQHPFFQMLENLAKKQESDPSFEMPKQMHQLLTTSLGYVSALLAIGWNQAALDFLDMDILPKQIPDFLSEQLVEAFRKVKGDEKALDFAIRQKKTEKIQFLIAQMLLNQNNIKAAAAQLEKLTQTESQLTDSALSSLCMIYMRFGDYQKAKELALASKNKEASYQLQEVLAQIALKEGNLFEAQLLYEEIADRSLEAKSFLARQAFSKDYLKRAKLLTIELLKEYPNHSTLRKNLLKIIEKQKLYSEQF